MVLFEDEISLTAQLDDVLNLCSTFQPQAGDIGFNLSISTEVTLFLEYAHTLDLCACSHGWAWS